MRTNELAAFASKRMRGAVTPAVSFVLVWLLLAGGLTLLGRALTLLSALLLEADGNAEPYRTWFPALFGVLAALLILMPLHFGLRRWIWCLDEEGVTPLRNAFFWFASPRRYIRLVGFLLVQVVFGSVVLLLSYFPAAIVWTVASVVRISDVWSVITIALGVLLLILGVVFASYILSGTFLSGYCFLCGYVTNPFRALVLSFRMMHTKRKRLFALLFHVLPYLLLSVTILFLPFTIPHLESCFAVLAKEYLAENIFASSHSTPKEDKEYVFTE